MSNPGKEGILKALSILCSFENGGTEEQKEQIPLEAVHAIFLPRECVDGCGGNATAFTPLFFFFCQHEALNPCNCHQAKL